MLAVCAVLTETVPATATTAGTVVGWGDNREGRTSVPVGLSGVTAVAGGFYHSLAVKGDGTVVSWGENGEGQTSVPVGLSGVTAVAAGGEHSLAVRGGGTVVAWGSNYTGQTSVPAELSGVTTVAAGFSHSLALKGDGTVVGWGNNYSGETDVPAGLSGVTAVAAGLNHSLAVKGDGTVVGWGYNQYGQTDVPAGLSGVTAVAAGGRHSLAVKNDGTVVGWGVNDHGQASVPAGLSGVTAVAAGLNHSLALKGDGTVVGWGSNTAGQTSVPAGLSGVTALAAGAWHSLAVTPYAPTARVADPVNLANQSAVIVSGTGKEATTANISVDDTDPATAPVTATAPVGPGGYSAPLDLSSLSDGTLTATVTLTDAAGATSPPARAIATKDTQTPASSATVTPGPNADGWNNSEVFVDLVATDSGTGVRQLSYSAVGAQAISTTTVVGASARVAISAEGETTLSYFASDKAGNRDSAKTVVVRLDITLPGAPTVSLTSAVNDVSTVVVSGTGEAGTTASISVDDEYSQYAVPGTEDDEDPGTAPVTAVTSVSESGYSAVLDLSDLSDGWLTATVTLTDAAGNTGPAGMAMARKVGTHLRGLGPVELAFFRVIGPVNSENRSIFTKYVAMAESGASYDQLLAQITRDYVTQAYDTIFRYRNDPAFSPVAKTAVPFNEDVYNRILTWVKAEGPLTIDGQRVATGAEPIWTYVAKSAPVWGAHNGGRRNGEKCFGAMGPGCKGTGLEGGREKKPHSADRFLRMDGREMHYIDIPVAVGSIVHDRACLEDRDADYYVAYCNGGPGDLKSAKMEELCAKHDVECQGVREWWKASANIFDGRHWRYRFGPYPYAGFENPRKSEFPTGAVPGSLADLYQDDASNMRVKPNRYTRLPTTPPSGIADKSLAHLYTNGEAEMTRVLFAPAGTPIDFTDAEFCGTGQASETQTQFNTTPWKYCGSGGTGGGAGEEATTNPPK